MKKRRKNKKKISHPITRSGMTIISLYKFLNQPKIKDAIENLLLEQENEQIKA